MANPIYPAAYTIAPNQVERLYYLGFPEAWKKELLVIAQKNNPRFKSEYGLPTNALKKMIDSWMDGIVSLRPLNAFSDDTQWLSACVPFNEKRIKVLFGIIKAWVTGTYISQFRPNPAVQLLAKEFNANIKLADISNLVSDKEVVLSDDTGKIREEAYQAIPLIAINKLLGKNLMINGTTLHLCYSAKNELISSPIEDPKSHHFYSYVFNFSVQTTPPERHALLLCNMSIRRWVPGRYDASKDVKSNNAINVHVHVGNDKYCQVPISFSYSANSFVWKPQDKACYDLWGYEPLIDTTQLWEEIEQSKGKYLLPYKSGMWSMTISKIGTGVSVKDKVILYSQVLSYLEGIAISANAANPGPRKSYKIPHFEHPQEYETVEHFKCWFAKCVETNQVTFEIYGLQNDPIQAAIMNQLEQKLIEDFGPNTEGTELVVNIVRREAGTLQEKLEDDSKNGKIQRCDEIVEFLGATNSIIACFFVIPGEDAYSGGGDPKHTLRNAFARTGRVVQFIVPEQEGSGATKQKILHAVYDLYRQLGVTALLDIDKAQTHAYASTRSIGMHICTQVHGYMNKGRFLPIFVDVDLLNGKTRVQCSAFENPSVSYREACLEMAKLFWMSDLEQRCVDACRSPVKQKLIELKSRHASSDNRVLFIATADGNSRPLWNGMSDKAIGDYEMLGEYIPRQIDTGVQKAPFMLPLVDTGVRIARIRNNAEVPDYFTAQRKKEDDSDKYSSATGVFQYGKDFWCITSKPNDPRFNKSFIESRIDHPTHDYAEKDMVEIYPLQLQKGDDPWEWVRYIFALQELPIQYNQAIVLPLPLHLAKNLTEYLFEP